MKMNTDKAWLLKKAEQEDGCYVSAGGPVDALEQPEEPSGSHPDEASFRALRSTSAAGLKALPRTARKKG